VDVAEQRKREPPRFVERRVAERAVGADRKQRRAALGELRGDLAQAAELRRSDAAPVVAIEHEDDVAPTQLGKVNLTAASRG
jgi:hypothetical protein